MKQLIFKTEYLDLIKSGLKTQTIRNWKRDLIKISDVGSFVSATNYRDKILIKIENVYKKNFQDINLEEAKLDGFTSLKIMQEKVLDIYKTIDFEATIIGFSFISSN